MAEFTLTINNDSLIGTAGIDHFVGGVVTGFTTGATGGVDTLDGAGGDDHFYLASSTTVSGTITGGADTDTVHAQGRIGTLTFVDVEYLNITSEALDALTRLTAEQLNMFQKLIGHVFPGDLVALEIGVNANVDFDTKLEVTATNGVDVRITATLGGFTLTGTRNNDRFEDQNSNAGAITIDLGAGNDLFVANNSGGLVTVLGGTGNDTVDLDGDTNTGLGFMTVTSMDGGENAGDHDILEATNTNISPAIVTNWEELRGTHVVMQIAQMFGFDTFTSSDPGAPFLQLTGVGGTFSFLNKAPSGVFFDTSQTTTAGNYTMSQFADQVILGNHDAVVNGGGGGDIISTLLEFGDEYLRQINGGDGNDTLRLDSALGAGQSLKTTFNGGAGTNTVEVAGNGRIVGLETLGLMELVAVAGNAATEIEFLNAVTAIDNFFAPPATKVIIAVEGAGGTVDFTTKAATLQAGDGIDFRGAAATSAINVTGSTRADDLETTSKNDTLRGGLGADRLFGRAGNDTYHMGNEASGVDQVVDSAGIDTVTSTITRSLLHGQYTEIEKLLLLGASAINGTGNGAANTITGNAKANVLDGKAGHDALTGGGGSDTLRGGTGNDTLVGGLGRDILVGGAGRDIFDFNAAAESVRGANRDTVSGLSRPQHDRIDLRTIDADRDGTAGNQAFKFIGAAAFSGVDGQLRFAGGILSGDTNGDRVADFEIKVTGVASMLAADLFL